MKPPRPVPRKFRMNTTSILFRRISRVKRDAWKAFCARRGMTMKERLEHHMQQDINQDAMPSVTA